MKLKSPTAFQYFLYEDVQGVRVGLGTEKSVERIRAKGFRVGSQRFQTKEQADAMRKELHRCLCDSPLFID